VSGSDDETCSHLIAGFRLASTALISDNLSRLPGAPGIRPFHRLTGVMAGRALTVRTRGGDNLYIHKALEMVRPGDVIVVDGGGDVTRALIGEIMTSIAASRGAAGFVLDGAIRDAGAMSRSDFPCFARAATHRGPYKNGPGEINVPISVGGMIVNPGDIIVGDDDGIVAFPVAGADELLAAVRAQAEREQSILQSIRENRYVSAYGKSV